MRRFRLFGFVLAIFGGGLSVARAADGQIDILPDGDTTYVISQPGSYILTGNVTMTSALSCIQITSSDVTLELNGHTIVGFGLGGSDIGIDATAADRINIRNGTVRGFGGGGIVVGNFSQLHDLNIRSCGGNGITASFDAEVARVKSVDNDQWGIQTNQRALIADSNFVGNNNLGNFGGIQILGGLSTIRHCRSNSNTPSGSGALTTIGIDANNGSTVEHCTVYLNGQVGAAASIGIQIGDFAVARNNSVIANWGPDAAAGATVYGIKAGINNQILDNSIIGNQVPDPPGGGSAFGIHVSHHCQIRGNHIEGSNGNGNESIGIRVDQSSRVENNSVGGHRNSTQSYGIRADGVDNVIIGNTTIFNETAGIRLASGGNYVISNRSADAAISNVGGNTLGAGDLANITY
jgi:hypothetical protein